MSSYGVAACFKGNTIVHNDMGFRVLGPWARQKSENQWMRNVCDSSLAQWVTKALHTWVLMPCSILSP